MHPIERKNITVILGEHDVSDSENKERVVRKIEKVTFHEDFFPNYQSWFEPNNHPHPVVWKKMLILYISLNFRR